MGNNIYLLKHKKMNNPWVSISAVNQHISSLISADELDTSTITILNSSKKDEGKK